MNAENFDATLNAWIDGIKSRYTRAEIQVANATDIVAGSRITVAEIKEEPGKVIGYFESRETAEGFEIRQKAIFDNPQELGWMPRAIVATVISCKEGCPIGVFKKSHGLN